MIKPRNQYVLIKPEKAEERSKGGIIIPEAHKTQPVIGTVLAIGTGMEYTDMEVGDKVLYSKYAGSEVEDNGETVLLMKEEDVLALVKEDKND